MSSQQKEVTANAVLVVIGDIGRSPRMCYHAKSLADNNYFVELVGYLDSLPDDVICKHQNIRLIPLRPVPKFIEFGKQFSKPFSMLLKCLWIYVVLLFALLFRIHCPTFIMMQNPPGVPTMFVCWLAARLYRARLIIDWHNYTYSMLTTIQVTSTAQSNNSSKHRKIAAVSNSNAGKSSSEKNQIMESRHLLKHKGGLVVRLIQKFEGFFGRHADLNICVTVAMRHNMQQQWNCSALTLYDKPPSWKFKKLDDEQKHELYLRFSKSNGPLSCFASSTNDPFKQEATRFSFRDFDGKVHLRSDRPFLLISSTSWTEDEDFGYLLDALIDYDRHSKVSSRESNLSGTLPSIFCVITGRGPMKAHYLEQISKASLQNVTIVTPWLEAEDYSRLLGSGDIGVSLHTSTSGLDLPMKAQDMFGSGLPVIGKRFPAINELIQDGSNGYLFDDATELCGILLNLVEGFPLTVAKLSTLYTNVSSDCAESWEKNWNANLLPHIKVLEYST